MVRKGFHKRRACAGCRLTGFRHIRSSEFAQPVFVEPWNGSATSTSVAWRSAGVTFSDPIFLQSEFHSRIVSLVTLA